MRSLRRPSGLPDGSLQEKAVRRSLNGGDHSPAYCGVGCNFKAEMKGEQVVRWPWKEGKANRGHSCVSRFAWGATHKERSSSR